VGLGGQRHTLAALPQGRPSILCRECWTGLGACPDGYKKITSPQSFELQTIQHTVSHCAMYTVTPHHEHNDVNVNDKISDFHGGHFLVSYGML